MTFSWFGRQMESATANGKSISYKYNADGLRTEKTVGSTVSKYEYTGDKLFYEKRGDLEFYYRYDAFGNIASISRAKSDGTSFALYTVCNSRGDVEELRRSTGELFARYVYDSWGNVLHIYDANGAEITSTANFAVQNPFRYRGYYYDNETGLYYLQSRYYDPVTHRFLNADNQLATDSDLTGFNVFAYCGNNPVTREDSGGQFWDTVFDVVSLAFSVVEVVNNPKSVWAWVGLAADVASLVIPFATGGGAVVKAISKTDNLVDTFKAVNKVDDVYDTVNTIDNTKDTLNLASGACFIAGTKILTATGYVSIEEISAGDMVYAKQVSSDEISLKKVKQTFIRDTYELVHLFVNDEEIVTTPEHPFYVPNNGWVTAINLRAGDILVTVNGKYVIVEKIQHEILENPVKVYNFEVEDFHTYFVSDISILVHNSCYNPIKENDYRAIINAGELEAPHAHIFKKSTNIGRVFRDGTMDNSLLIDRGGLKFTKKHFNEIMILIDEFYGKR